MSRRDLATPVPPALRPVIPFVPAIAIIGCKLLLYPTGVGPWAG